MLDLPRILVTITALKATILLQRARIRRLHGNIRRPTVLIQQVKVLKGGADRRPRWICDLSQHSRGDKSAIQLPIPSVAKVMTLFKTCHDRLHVNLRQGLKRYTVLDQAMHRPRGNGDVLSTLAPLEPWRHPLQIVSSLRQQRLGDKGSRQGKNDVDSRQCRLRALQAEEKC